MRRVSFGKLVCYDLSSIGRTVVNDDKFPIKASVDLISCVCAPVRAERERIGANSLFCECAIKKPCDNRKVATFVVGGKNYGVLVFGCFWCHFGRLIL